MALDELIGAIRRRGATRRSLTAVAGAPGSGKSTLAEALVEQLNHLEPGSAELIPMDGYHFDDIILNARGLRPRKGAPHTFDVAGFRHMLGRLSANEEPEIFIPRFDRSIEIARAAAGAVPQAARHLVVEGNYLLLGQTPWDSLAPHFDTTVFLNVSRAELQRRLSARWQGFDYTPEAILAKLEDNDLPNADLVIAASTAAEFVIQEGDWRP